MTAVSSFAEAFKAGNFTLGDVKYENNKPVEKKGNVLGFGGNATDIKAQEPALTIIKQLIEERTKTLKPDPALIGGKPTENTEEGENFLVTALLFVPRRALDVVNLVCDAVKWVLNLVSGGRLFASEEKKDITNTDEKKDIPNTDDKKDVTNAGDKKDVTNTDENKEAVNQ